MPGVIPWSYSTLSAYETCPKRFYLTRISKQVSEPQTQATMWGNEVHQALEKAVQGSQALAARFSEYQPIVDRIRATEGQKHTESKFALTASFKPTTFFAKDAWFRGVIDLNIVRPTLAITLDYKTGKVKTDGDQLKLFAATTFAQFPFVERVKTGYVWLAANKITTEQFTKEDVPRIWQEFTPRIRRMEESLSADHWPPKPSGLCKNWCPVGKKLCDFCGS